LSRWAWRFSNVSRVPLNDTIVCAGSFEAGAPRGFDRRRPKRFMFAGWPDDLLLSLPIFFSEGGPRGGGAPRGELLAPAAALSA
jgi:hypothetical protein